VDTRTRAAELRPTASFRLRFTIERWIAFWKDRFAKAHPDAGKFQDSGFHHRLRDGESYAQKWLYVRENPVRAALVSQPDA
jgi:hypothetical protein